VAYEIEILYMLMFVFCLTFLGFGLRYLFMDHPPAPSPVPEEEATPLMAADPPPSSPSSSSWDFV